MNIQEEIEKLKKQQNLNIENNRIHDQIFKAYNEKTLSIPDVNWHLNVEEIDLSLQRDGYRKELLVGGITIIPDVDIELLLNSMTKENAAMFRRKELYEQDLPDMAISKVVNYWIHGTKLIPPTIMVFTQEYAETLNISIIPSKELQPVDGKHRLKVAYFFGVKQIPILVRTIQAPIIKKTLRL